MNLDLTLSLSSLRMVQAQAQVPVSGPTVAPVIEYQGNSARVVSNGEWAGSPAPTFTYQWQQFESGSWSDLVGSTNIDVVWSTGSGIGLRCIVTASNTVGGNTFTAAGESNTLD